MHDLVQKLLIYRGVVRMAWKQGFYAKETRPLLAKQSKTYKKWIFRFILLEESLK